MMVSGHLVKYKITSHNYPLTFSEKKKEKKKKKKRKRLNWYQFIEYSSNIYGWLDGFLG